MSKPNEVTPIKEPTTQEFKLWIERLESDIRRLTQISNSHIKAHAEQHEAILSDRKRHAQLEGELQETILNLQEKNNALRTWIISIKETVNKL